MCKRAAGGRLWGPHVLPGSPLSPAHTAVEQGHTEPGPKGTATAAFTTQEPVGLMGSQHTEAFCFLAREVKGGQHLLPSSKRHLQTLKPGDWYLS